MPIITITIIASRIENEEERVITLGGDTLIEIHSVNSLDKSIFVARLSRIISHATDRQLSEHASMFPLEFKILVVEKRGRSFFEEAEEKDVQVYAAYAFFEINEPRDSRLFRRRKNLSWCFTGTRSNCSRK